MTVNYSNRVATNTRFGVFLKLLTRWKGSVYKLVWADLLLYLIIYYFLNILYRFGLNDHKQRIFEKIVKYFAQYSNAIPLSFVLGFFVSAVYARWWNQYCSIPYPDNIAILVGTSIHGKDEKSKIIRRTIIRYVCAAFTITLTMISPKAKKRFPTLDHFVEAGLLNLEEKQFIEQIDKDYPTYSSKYWLPLAWASNVTTTARMENLLEDDLALRDILEHISSFRENCKKLTDFDWICIPLVYTQVVTLAVYLYFLFTVIGNQFLETDPIIIFPFPLMSCVQLFFYMGWLKVAESLINPFGEDDDDFQINWMIDRHLQVGYLLVDKIHNEHPTLRKDQHWNQIAPQQLPFTLASKKYINEHPLESTSNIQVQKTEQDLICTEDMQHFNKTPQNTGNILQRFFSGDKKFIDHPHFHLKKVSYERKNLSDDAEIMKEFLSTQAE